MADNENTKTSAGLGELFIEFGSKGLGGLVKGLNTVSASFLLTKNAGQQMLQPLANMSKQAGQGVIALEKFNSVTGISVKQLDNLRRWTKLNNIDFNDYIGQIHSLQIALDRMNAGDANAITGFSMLGLSPADLDPSKPLESMDKIARKIREIQRNGREEDKHRASLALQMLGLNEQLVYAFEKGNRKVDKSIELTDKQRQKLEEQNKAWLYLQDASGQFFQKTIAEADWLTAGINKATEGIKALIHNFEEFNKRKKEGQVSKEEQNYRRNTAIMELGAAASAVGAGAAIGSLILPGLGTLAGASIGGIVGLAEMHNIHKSRQNNMASALHHENLKNAYKAIEQGDDGFSSINQPTAQGISALNRKGSGIPFNNVKNDNRRAEININVEQNVTSENGQEAANEVVNIIQDNLVTMLGYNMIINNSGGFNR